jgi:hypothetical protein
MVEVLRAFPALAGETPNLQGMATQASPKRPPSAADHIRDAQDVSKALTTLWRCLTPQERTDVTNDRCDLWIEIEVRRRVGRTVWNLCTHLVNAGRTLGSRRK